MIVDVWVIDEYMVLLWTDDVDVCDLPFLCNAMLYYLSVFSPLFVVVATVLL